MSSINTYMLMSSRMCSAVAWHCAQLAKCLYHHLTNARSSHIAERESEEEV